MTPDDFYDAALTLAFWCVIFFVGGAVVLVTAFLYRVIVEQISARLGRRPGELSDQTWRSRR